MPMFGIKDDCLLMKVEGEGFPEKAEEREAPCIEREARLVDCCTLEVVVKEDTFDGSTEIDACDLLRTDLRGARPFFFTGVLMSSSSSSSSSSSVRYSSSASAWCGIVEYCFFRKWSILAFLACKFGKGFKWKILSCCPAATERRPPPPPLLLFADWIMEDDERWIMLSEFFFFYIC